MSAAAVAAAAGAYHPGVAANVGVDKEMMMGSVGGGGDDASSGYGSPDADTCENPR